MEAVVRAAATEREEALLARAAAAGVAQAPAPAPKPAPAPAPAPAPKPAKHGWELIRKNLPKGNQNKWKKLIKQIKTSASVSKLIKEQSNNKLNMFNDGENFNALTIEDKLSKANLVKKSFPQTGGGANAYQFSRSNIQ